jgi:hypothetical protein
VRSRTLRVVRYNSANALPLFFALLRDLDWSHGFLLFPFVYILNSLSDCT